MSVTRKIKGIIFDMDNTLLQSTIHFAAMKNDIFDYLLKQGIVTSEFSVQEHTSSTLIEYARKAGITDEIYAALMGIAEKHELLGMEGAGLEPGVKEFLHVIYRKYVLVVVTNNSCKAAVKALELTKVIHYFDLIVGREQMTALKPSPSGFHYVKDQFKHIAEHEWISVGDSWIDGKAANESGISFVSYKTSLQAMRSKGVEPIGQINSMVEFNDFI